jgi:hypothetical protein
MGGGEKDACLQGAPGLNLKSAKGSSYPGRVNILAVGLALPALKGLARLLHRSGAEVFFLS